MMFLSRTLHRVPHRCMTRTGTRLILASSNRNFHSAVGGRLRQQVQNEEKSLQVAEDKEVTTVEDGSLPLLRNDTLVVTRKMELAQILIGFEQANKYEIQNESGQVVGYIAEESNVGRAILRSVTTTHRSFTATIFDADQKPILRVRRPFYFITSSMFIELPDTGEVIGEIHQKWHLWRRRYELFVNKKQAFSVDGELLAWDFNMVNEKQEVVASVNKNFTNLAREIFTDANSYVIRLGQHVLDPYVVEQQRQKLLDQEKKEQEKLESGEKREVPLVETGVATHASNELQKVETEKGLTIVAPSRPLSIDEKSLVLAAAVAIDFDYFSHTSGRPGLLGWLPLPIPIPSPYPEDVSSGAPDSADGASADAAGAAGMGSGVGDTFPPDEIHDIGEGGQRKDQWGDDYAEDVDDDAGQWSSYDDTFDSGDGWENHTDIGDDDYGEDDEGGGGILGALGSLFGDDD